MLKIIKLIALSMALVSMSVSADQNNPELEGLFYLLKESQDPVEASVLTQKIWEHWYQSDNPTVEQWLEMGEISMRRGELDDAVKIFSKIIGLNPYFSEGWNRRATVYYMMGEYQLSTKDIEATLKLEPRHFGALSGQGMIYTKLNQRDQALKYYEEALKYNPHLPGVKKSIEIIKKSIKREVI